MAVDFTAIFKAQDKVSATLSKINKTGNGLNSTFNKLAATAAGVFTVASVAQWGKESAQVFTSFEKGMNEVFTLLPDISDDAMAQMTAQIKDFDTQMGLVTTQSVPALYQALSAGVSQDNVFSFLEQANKLAVGGVAELEDSVGILTTITNNYKSMNLETSTASDLLFKTVAKGVTTIPELASAMGNVVPSAASVGIAFEDVSAAMATMTASLGQGSTSVATTKLRSMFDELSQTGSQVDKTFRGVAGKGFRDFIKSGGTLQGALQMLNNKAESSNKTMKELFSSTEAGDAALILGSTAAYTFADNIAQMGSAAGATDAAFAKMKEGFQFKLNLMNSRLDNFKINVGEKLVDAFNYLWDKASPSLDRLGKKLSILGLAFDNMFIKVHEGTPVWDAFKDAFKDIVPADAMVMLEDLVGVLGFVFDKTKDIASYVVANWPSIKPIVIGIAGAFALWKISTTIYDVVTLGQAMVALTVAIWKTSAAIWANVGAKAADKGETLAIMALYAGDFVGSLWTSITAIGVQTAALVVNKAQMAAQTAGTLLFKGAQLMSTGVTTALTAAQWALNAAFVASPIGWVVLGIGALVGAGVLLWKNWDTVKTKAIELWQGIQTAFAPIGQFFSGIWDGVQSGFKGLINFIVKGFNFMANGINKLSVDIPDWVPLVGGKKLSFSIPTIPMLAKGSMDAPGTFIAGERGPELITGAGGSRVFPSDDTERILSALERRNQPLAITTSAFHRDDDAGESRGEKTFNINLAGSGTIKAEGLSEEKVLDILIVHLKPILMKIIQTEIYEEGDLSYEY